MSTTRLPRSIVLKTLASAPRLTSTVIPPSSCKIFTFHLLSIRFGILFRFGIPTQTNTSNAIIESVNSYVNGQVHQYTGERTIEAFTSFVAEKKGDAVHVEAPTRVTPSVVAPAEPVEAASDVAVLSADNFASTIAEGYWLVEL